jgi:hypothetical protein
MACQKRLLVHDDGGALVCRAPMSLGFGAKAAPSIAGKEKT